MSKICVYRLSLTLIVSNYEFVVLQLFIYFPVV